MIRSSRAAVAKRATTFTAGRAVIAGADRALSIGLVALGALLTVALDRHHPEVFLAAPSLLAFLATYQTSAYSDSVALGMYRRHLERTLNERLGMDIYLWERVVSQSRRSRNNLSIILLTTATPLLILGLTGYGYYIIVDHGYDWWVYILFTLLVVHGGIMLLFGLLELQRTFIWTTELLDNYENSNVDYGPFVRLMSGLHRSKD